MLFLEYIPKSLKDIKHHPNLVRGLKRLATKWTSIQNLIFHGPEGAGKKTLITCLMCEVYGDLIYITKKSCFNYFIVEYSAFHIEYFLTEKTSNDFIKHLISRISTLNVINASFHTVIIHCVSKLPQCIIFRIKTIVDQFVDTARFIFICNSIGNMTCLKDRCLKIRVPIISFDNIENIINCVPEYNETVTQDTLRDIYTKCSGNLLDIFLHIQRRYQQNQKHKKKINFRTVDSIYYNLMIAITNKVPFLIKKHIFELLVIPYSYTIIIQTIQKNTFQQIKNNSQELNKDTKFQKLFQLSADCEWKCNKTSNIMYILIYYCYKLMELV